MPEITYANSATAIMQVLYPVGTIYTNKTVATNPGTLFGFGTWVALTDRVVVGKAASGTFATAGATGGAETHALSTAELPSHTHATMASTTTGFDGNVLAGGSGGGAASLTQGGVAFRVYANPSTGTTGSGTAHNNLQPYVVAYMWERTA